jgi:hypothetical protein
MHVAIMSPGVLNSCSSCCAGSPMTLLEASRVYMGLLLIATSQAEGPAV